MTRAQAFSPLLSPPHHLSTKFLHRISTCSKQKNAFSHYSSLNPLPCKSFPFLQPCLCTSRHHSTRATPPQFSNTLIDAIHQLDQILDDVTPENNNNAEISRMEKIIQALLERHDSNLPCSHSEWMHFMQSDEAVNLIATQLGCPKSTVMQLIAKDLQKHSQTPPSESQTDLHYHNIKGIIPSQADAPTLPASKQVASHEKGLSFLREWLIKNDGKPPTAQQKSYLLSETQWSRKKLLNHLRILMDRPKGEITQETKDIVHSWLQENHFRRPTNDEKLQLMDLTKWNQTQLEKQVYTMRRAHQQAHGGPPGEAEGAKAIFEEWMLRNKRRPTGDERQTLCQQTGWSPQRLNSAVSYWCGRQDEKEITPEARHVVRTWLLRNDNRTPGASEKQALQQETNLTMHQVNYLLKYYRNPPGDVHIDSDRQFLFKWAQSNEYRYPTNDELPILQNLTLGQLTKTQIHRIIDSFRRQNMHRE